MVIRIYNVEGCLLRTRAVQWDGVVYGTIERVSEPRVICVLGRVSSDRESKPIDSPSYLDRFHQVHESHEP